MDCNEVPSKVIAKSKAGCAYEVLGGHGAIHEGQRAITFLSQGGSLGRMDFQVAAVNEALGSVSELAESGHIVIPDKERICIYIYI